MRSALRKLCQHGVEALRPQKVNDHWRKPTISKRVAADLRKMAIRNGTYGKFDTETGVGWDPNWDTPHPKKGKLSVIDLLAKYNSSEEDSTAAMVRDEILTGSNPGAIQSIRPPKGHKRERTRENRAKNIEKLLEQADEKIEEYRADEAKKKDSGTGIQEEFKRMVKGASW